MDETTLSFVISAVALIISIVSFSIMNANRRKQPDSANGFSTRPLQLQAYERLVLLTERISIPNLVSRANQPMNAREMQVLLIESIKQEYEYNVSQQVYVSPVAWEAVRNLKEQNMLIINQVASALPEDARGIDLNKRLLEFTMNQQKGSLHSIVMEAINFEAKKLMK